MTGAQMRVSLGNKIFVGFTSVLVVLGLICGVSVVNVTDIALQSPMAAQSREAIAGLERLWRLAATADAAPHRYVMSRDSQAFLAYGRAKMELHPSIESLRQTNNGSPAQK